mmetsp:Transcript_28063/g.34648  ORF Transcript_28063/g.34648 Transcript_28063/m.34648 type:complete len:618 (+) Transcript_28063:101-1954(+)
MKFCALSTLALIGLPAASAFAPVAPAGRQMMSASASTPLFATVVEKSKSETEVPSSDDLSMKDLKKLVKDNFPDLGFVKRQSLGKATMIEMLSKAGKISNPNPTTFNFSLDDTTELETASSSTPFPKAVEAFPGALTNNELVQMIDATLAEAGYDREKTLVATSLCCDEVNRPLESDLASVYTSNFWMGGLAGFPFGGAVAFGAMAAHIPDDGSCLMVYGPHVGVDKAGKVGTVERRGRANGGSCCGSAVAATGYVADVLAGKIEKAAIPDDAVAAQQAYVGDMLLPYAQRLEDADDKMVELPYALYDAQTDMVEKIIAKSAGGVAGDGQIAVLGGVQINTPEGYSDYYLPLSFELYNNKGELIEDILATKNRPFSKVKEVFPGALSNAELVNKVTATLAANGYEKETTLVATSLCCDEVNRPLEAELSSVYDTNFNMGGLAGFPFGGAVSFGAMAAHIPDGGSTLVVYGPHVGVDSTGAAGTVERRGRAKGGSCCGSAVAASGYVSSIFNGDEPATLPADVEDAQQYFVGKALLPYAEQLEEAEDKMVELPYALYGAQSDLIKTIVEGGAGGVADGTVAVLGGIQINTPPGFTDYYMPLSFDLYNNKGELVKQLWK